MRAGEVLGGPNVTGKPGDWVLENDEVVFVIDALGGGGGFAESGGNLVDAADAKVRLDELGQLFTCFGSFPRQGVYTAIDAHPGEGGAAVVVARGHELLDANIAVVTEYTLAPGDRALLLRTTLTNEGKVETKPLGLGDAVQWGGAEKFAPGHAVGFKGPSKGPFVGGLGRFVSYGLTSTEGEIAAQNGGSWTDTEQKLGVTIEPGKSVTYERVFVVGERPDAASVLAELTKSSGGAVGGISVALIDAAKKPIAPPLGAKVVLSTPDGADVMSIVAFGISGTYGVDGTVYGEVPPGKWVVSFAPSAGRRGTGPKIPIEVKPNEVTRVTLQVSGAGKIRAVCNEPCRATIEGIEGTPTPSFGPAHVAAAAKNQLFAVTSEMSAPVAPGKYKVTCTRGPEYSADVKEVEVREGGETAVACTLARVVDTRGYVSTDFHQHTMLSADAAVAVADRIRANVAEGLEVAVASEHNNVVDFGPTMRDLDVGRHFVSISGNEITTDGLANPWGHANVFPLSVDENKPRGGATVLRNRSAREIFAEVRALPGPTRVIQVNHPRAGPFGYFDRLGFDRKKGAGTSPDYDPKFDALEVWNGRNIDARGKVLDDYLALLRTNHPVTPIASTDTHGIVGQEAGYPRTFVRVEKDDALDTWNAARTDDLVRGVRERRDAILTNGPFLRVQANGVGLGALVRPREGKVDVQVVVTSVPFADVTRLEVRTVNGARVQPPFVTVTPTKSASGANEARATFTLRAAKDDAFVVIASGTTPMRPLLVGEDEEIKPWAMTSAIWVDADADGKSLGR